MRRCIHTKEDYGERILSLFFPRRCPVCGKVLKEEGVLACRRCKDRLAYIRPPYCLKCGRPLKQDGPFCISCAGESHYFDRTVSLWEYSAAMKQSLYGFKYKNKREYARFYGTEAVRMYGYLLDNWQIQAVVPVPLHKSRLRRRGYNQAQCFGRVIACGLSLPLLNKALFRVKNTKPQKELPAEQRRRNLEGAFLAGEEAARYRCVLVVDDIYTTGSTLDAAAAALKKAGVEKVYGLTIASGKEPVPAADHFSQIF